MAYLPKRKIFFSFVSYKYGILQNENINKHLKNSITEVGIDKQNLRHCIAENKNLTMRSRSVLFMLDLES